MVGQPVNNDNLNKFVINVTQNKINIIYCLSILLMSMR